jgi:RNA polymerase sigma-70 factor, ECF subfamily
MTTPVEDGVLLDRITRQDTAALAQLYDRYGRLVFSIACQILSDESLAEEVTQDVFVQIWNKAATYEAAQGKVLTWLSSIARHRAIDQFRRRKVRPEGSSVAWDNCCDDSGDDTLDVEPKILSGEQRRQLVNALLTLPTDQREALALAYFKGLTQQEIATHLREPLGTIKTRIRLALQKLRSVMEAPETFAS